MKIKTLLLFCILFLGFRVSHLTGQVTKGSFFIERGLFWDFSRVKSGPNANAQVQSLIYNPVMGVFLSESVLLSGGVQLKEERFSSSEEVRTTYGVSLDMRWYLSAPKDRTMLWFLEIGGEYARINIANSFDRNTELDPWTARISLGTDIFLAQGLSINSRLYYRRGKTSNFSFNKFSDIGITSGLRYYFLPKGVRPRWTAISPGPGDWMIGGSNIDIRSDRISPGKNFNLSLRPRAGVFVHPHFMLGSSLFISYFRSSSDVVRNTNQSYGLTPFVRYYTESVPSFIKGFLELNAGLQRNASIIRVSGGTANNVFRNSNVSRLYGAAVGLDIFLNPNFALELSFAYNRFRASNFTDPDTPVKQQFFNLNFGFQYFVTRQP